MEIKEMTPDQLKKLAANKSNIVMQYQDTPAPLTIMALPDVKDSIEQLWKEFKEMKSNKTITSIQARKMRKELEDRNPRWAAFSKSHPLIFDRVVDHQTGDKEIYALMHMIALRKKQDDGEITNGAETLQEFIFKMFAKPKA